MNAKQVRLPEFQFPVDYEQVYRLWQSLEGGVHVGRSDTLMELRKRVTRDPELFLVAEVNGAIVGSVVVGFDGWRGLIYHLAVATPFRSQSLGSRLMNEVETRLQAKGCLKCYLMVTVDNPEAGKYYEQRGWYEMDTVRLYGNDLQ